MTVAYKLAHAFSWLLPESSARDTLRHKAVKRELTEIFEKSAARKDYNSIAAQIETSYTRLGGHKIDYSGSHAKAYSIFEKDHLQEIIELMRQAAEQNKMEEVIEGLYGLARYGAGSSSGANPHGVIPPSLIENLRKLQSEAGYEFITDKFITGMEIVMDYQDSLTYETEKKPRSGVSLEARKAFYWRESNRNFAADYPEQTLLEIDASPFEKQGVAKDRLDLIFSRTPATDRIKYFVEYYF